MGTLKLTLSDGQRRALALILFALAVLLALDAIYQVVTHVRWRLWIPDLPTAAATSRPADTQPAGTQPAGTQPAESQPAGAATPPAGPPGAPAAPGPPGTPPGAVEVAEAIRVRNIMAPVPPRGHGLNLTGVLGKTALFQSSLTNQPVAIDVGQTVQGVKVRSIDGYSVTVEHAGVETTLHLFPPAGAASPAPGLQPPSGAPPQASAPSPAPGVTSPQAGAAPPATQPVTSTASTPSESPTGSPPSSQDASISPTTQPEGAVP